MAATLGTTEKQALADNKALWVEMRSPDGPIFAGLCRTVIVPGTKGTFGVLVRHAPLMSSLEVGLTKVSTSDGQELRFVTGGGFVEVQNNRVLLLVDFAEPTDAIDLVRAQDALNRAKARLRNPSEEVDVARAEAAMQRATTRLRFGGKA
ncbi:MAG: ATP synthase epsilon chain [Planctomycetota bacterium]|nr:MAG: ATP synthase epsilon chain [Planctomycetota bacterium]